MSAWRLGWWMTSVYIIARCSMPTHVPTYLHASCFRIRKVPTYLRTYLYDVGDDDRRGWGTQGMKNESDVTLSLVLFAVGLVHWRELVLRIIRRWLGSLFSGTKKYHILVYHLLPWISVTSLGKILSLRLAKFKSLCLFIVGLFSIWQSIVPTLVKSLWYWANIHCCKWPNIEKTM